MTEESVFPNTWVERLMFWAAWLIFFLAVYGAIRLYDAIIGPGCAAAGVTCN